MAIKGIVFDKDGTLIDVDRTWIPVYRAILQQLFDVDEKGAERMMEPAGYDPSTGRMRAGSIMAGGTTDQLVDIWWKDCTGAERLAYTKSIDNDFIHLVEKHLTPLMPLKGLLSELRSDGFRLGVATNDSFASASRHMRLLGVEDFFDALITYDTVPRPKPSGDMIRMFAAKTGLQPHEIAIVGDNTHDLEEAHNGGAGLGIAVLTGNAARADIDHLADHVIASVADLPALLRSL